MSEQNNEQRSQAAGTDTVDRGNSNAKLEQLEAYREDATGGPEHQYRHPHRR